MSASTVALVGALVYRFDALLPILEEHLDDQEGEILPHLLMSDIARWAEEVVQQERPPDTLQELLNFLEVAYSKGGEDVREVIAVSFLEHLPRPEEPGHPLREMVGPLLAKQLRRIG